MADEVEIPPDFEGDTSDWPAKSWRNRYKINGLQQWHLAYHSGQDDLVPKTPEGIVNQREFDDSPAIYYEWPEVDSEGIESIEKVVLNKSLDENYWGNGAAYGANAYHYNFPPANPVEGDIWCRSPADIPIDLVDAVDGLEKIYYKGEWVPIISKPTIQLGVEAKPTEAAPLGSVAIMSNGNTFISSHSLVSRWIKGLHTHTIAGDFNDMTANILITLTTLRLNWDDKKFYKPRILAGDARKISWVEADINDYTVKIVNSISFPEEWDTVESTDNVKALILDNELNVCSHIFFEGSLKTVSSLNTSTTCFIKIFGSPNKSVVGFFSGTIALSGVSLSGTISTLLDEKGEAVVELDSYRISSVISAPFDNWYKAPKDTVIDGVLLGKDIESKIVSVDDFIVDSANASGGFEDIFPNATGDPELIPTTENSFSRGESLISKNSHNHFILDGILHAYVGSGASSALKELIPAVTIMGSHILASGAVGANLLTAYAGFSADTTLYNPVTYKQMIWGDGNTEPFYGSTTQPMDILDFSLIAGYSIPFTPVFIVEDFITNTYRTSPIESYSNTALKNTDFRWGTYYKYAETGILQDFVHPDEAPHLYVGSRSIGEWLEGEPNTVDVNFEFNGGNIWSSTATWSSVNHKTGYSLALTYLKLRSKDLFSDFELPEYSLLKRELWVKVIFYGRQEREDFSDLIWWDNADLVQNAHAALVAMGLTAAWTKYAEYDGLQDEVVDLTGVAISGLEAISLTEPEDESGTYELSFSFQFQVRWSTSDITLFDDIPVNSYPPEPEA